MTPLIRFLLKWSLIGVAAGWVFVALFLVTDTGGMGSLWLRSESRLVTLFVLGLSFGVTFAQVTVLAAVLLRSDFGGEEAPPDRLARWKAGGSAEIDRDVPL